MVLENAVIFSKLKGVLQRIISQTFIPRHRGPEVDYWNGPLERGFGKDTKKDLRFKDQYGRLSLP